MISLYINDSKLDMFRSSCFCGKKTLRFYELIPVISYFALNGKCSECGEKISLRYLIVELLFIAIGLITYVEFGLTFIALLNYLAFAVLIVIAFTDYYKRIIPNALIGILLLFFVAEAFFIPLDLLWRLAAAALILLSGIILNTLSNKYYGKEALGYGDIKLLIVLALLFGGFTTLAALWLSSAAGLAAWIFMRKYSAIYKYEAKIPFGFFISFGITFTVIYKYELYRLYEKIILGY